MLHAFSNVHKCFVGSMVHLFHDVAPRLIVCSTVQKWRYIAYCMTLQNVNFSVEVVVIHVVMNVYNWAECLVCIVGIRQRSGCPFA